jgi:hypothetical protein
MPVYGAVLSLSGLAKDRDYSTLSRVVSGFHPSLPFSDPAVGVPAAVCFYSSKNIEQVHRQIFEQVHPGDQFALFEVSRMAPEIHEASAQSTLRDLQACL